MLASFAALSGQALKVKAGSQSVTSSTALVDETNLQVNGATAGVVKLQFAQNTSDGTATAIQASSSLVARRA